MKSSDSLKIMILIFVFILTYLFHFGHFCTEPGRPLPDPTGTVTLSKSHIGAGVSKGLLPILEGLLSDRKSVNNARW